MKRRWPLTLLFTIPILLFLIFYGRSFVGLLQTPSSESTTLVEYRASKESSPQLLGNELKARNVEKIQQGFAVFHMDQNGPFLATLLPPASDKMLTLHLSIATDGTSRVGLQINNKIVQFPWRFHHQDVDLTPYLLEGKPSELLLFFDKVDMPHAILEEFVIKESSTTPYFPPLGLFVLIIAMVYALISLRQSKIEKAVWVAIFALAFYLRWEALGGAVGQPLEGDAPRYFEPLLRSEHKSVWIFGKREPFFIWIQLFFGHLFNLNDFFPRILTVLFSVGSIILTGSLLKMIFNKRCVGMLGALLLAINPFMIWNSTRGERNELFLLLMLLTFVVYLVKRFKPNTKSILLGALAGALSLTWLIGLFGSVLTYIFMNLKTWKEWKRHSLFFGVLFLFVGPFFFSALKTAGDPFISLNANTNFYKNVRETGVASYEGEKKSLFRYILIEEGPKIPWQVLKGYGQLFLHPESEMNTLSLGGTPKTPLLSWILFPILVLGLGLTLWRKEWTVFIFLFSFLNLSVAFLNEVQDPRLFLHVLPFLAAFVGYGASETGNTLINQCKLREMCYKLFTRT